MKKQTTRALAGLVMMVVAPGAASAGPAPAITNLGSVDGVSYLAMTAAFSSAAAPAVMEIPCPGEKRPVGGGYQIGLHELDTLRSAAPADLNRDGRIDGWRVVAETEQPNTLVGTDASAICRKGKVRYVSKAAALPASPGALTLTARCPSDMHVTGGGAIASIDGDPHAAYVSSSYPIDGNDADTKPDDGWRAHFYGSAQPGTQVIAICAPTKQSYPSRSKQNPEQDQTIKAGYFGLGYTVTCPETKHLLGMGAFIAGSPGEVRVHSTFMGDDASDGDSIPDDNGGMSFSNGSTSDQATEGWAICG
jgi:hypothetical protein